MKKQNIQAFLLIIFLVGICIIGCKKEKQEMPNEIQETTGVLSASFDTVELFKFNAECFRLLSPLTRVLVSKDQIIVDNTYFLSSLSNSIRDRIFSKVNKESNLNSIVISAEAEKLQFGLVPVSRLRDGPDTYYLKSLDDLLVKTYKIEHAYREYIEITGGNVNSEYGLLIYITPDAEYRTVSQVLFTADTRYEEFNLVINTPSGKEAIPVKHSVTPHVGGEWNDAQSVLTKGIIDGPDKLCTAVSFELTEEGVTVRTSDVGPPLEKDSFSGFSPVKASGYTDLECSSGQTWERLFREESATITYPKKDNNDSDDERNSAKINIGIERLDGKTVHVGRSSGKWDECELKILLEYLSKTENSCSYFTTVGSKNNMVWSDIAKVLVNAISIGKGNFRYVVLQ